MNGSIAEQLEANAAADADGVWLTSPESGAKVTWTEAANRARDVACHLDALGLEPSAAVAVASPNSIGSTLCFAGITYGGYLATPMNLVAGARVLAYVIGHSKASVIFCADESRELMGRRRNRLVSS